GQWIECRATPRHARFALPQGELNVSLGCPRLSRSVHLPSDEAMPSKPRLGQNFLNDAQAIQRIAASLGDLSGRTVVEIGPGAGAITAALVARAAHVLAVELDSGLAAHLRTQFSADRVTVIEQDVLSFD